MNPQTLSNLVAGGAAGLVSSGLSFLTGRSNAEHSADLQYENWAKMQAFNSPLNQLKRSAAAGVNPFVSPTGAQPIGFTGGSASAPSSVPVDFGSSFSQVMQGLLASRGATRADIENEKIGDFFDAQTKNQLMQAGYHDAVAKGQQLANEITQLYGKTEARAKINNIMKDTALKLSEIMLNDDLGELAAQQRLESMAREAHERALSVLGQKDIDAFDKRFNAYIEEIKSQISANYAGAEQSRATAENQRAQAETENQSRVSRVAILKTQSALFDLEKQVKDKTAVSRALAELEQSQLVNRKLVQEIETAYKDNNIYYFRFAVDMLHELMQAYRDGSIGVNQNIESIGQLKQILGKSKKIGF